MKNQGRFEKAGPGMIFLPPASALLAMREAI
jgi:hypothetical protein